MMERHEERLRYSLPRQQCSACRQPIDSHVLKQLPRPGDIILCATCGQPHAYADNMTLRDLTSIEMRQMMAVPAVQRFLTEIRRLHNVH